MFHLIFKLKHIFGSRYSNQINFHSRYIKSQWIIDDFIYNFLYILFISQILHPWTFQCAFSTNNFPKIIHSIDNASHIKFPEKSYLCVELSWVELLWNKLSLEWFNGMNFTEWFIVRWSINGMNYLWIKSLLTINHVEFFRNSFSMKSNIY